MDVAVVGAGPAGSLAAYRLARAGVRATLFDASHPREKPCGGGVTGKALALLPPAPSDDPLPARFVDACRFESGDGAAVELRLPRPIAVAARRDLDAWLLRRAVAAGARHVPERVVAVETNALRTSARRVHAADVIVGADGANSIVRRSFLAPIPKERLTLAAGWFAPGAAEMLVRFLPGAQGYLWLFPRPDHVGVGICAPLAAQPTRALLGRLESEAARSFRALEPAGAERYAHLIPSPSADPRSILEIARERVALVGDAAALADPITGEGIYYALRSAELLAETLAAGRPLASYAERALEDFGRDLLTAAALRERFYAPGFTRRMIRLSARSPAIRRVLGELVLGEQGYLGLKRRLLRALPAVIVDSLLRRSQ
jgi:geranylgeranyl reductase family protein